MNRIDSRFSLLGAALLVACGGSQSPATNAADANCPASQTFDGEFCQVDQSVATAEVSTSADVTGEKKAAEVGEESIAEEPPTDEPVVPNLTANEPNGGSDASPIPDPEDVPPGGEHEEPVAETKKPSFAAPVDYAMAAQSAPVMQYLASSHLPSGARPLGTPFAGQFATGQILEQKVQLKAGKCYTVVALGLPPVREVTVALYGANAEVPLVKDEMRGPQAVLGSRNDCYKPAETGSVRLVISVEEGRGLAAAQMFQK